MTENKRFNIVKSEFDFYFDITDTEKRWEIGDIEEDNLPCFEDLVNLLNELYEENEQLKRADTIADLETQIMQLRGELNCYQNKCANLEIELDYYKTKCASLETGLINEQRKKLKPDKKSQKIPWHPRGVW